MSDGLLHFSYELQACVEGALAVYTAEAGAVARNCYLESHLLHARALIEFLIDVKDRPRPDDMLRTDFATEWTPTPASSVARLQERRADVNKHLAHLTWARVKDDGPIAWTYLEMASDVLSVSEAWVEHLFAVNAPLGPIARLNVQAARRRFEDGADSLQAMGKGPTQATTASSTS